jgi:hypothetical protein
VSQPFDSRQPHQRDDTRAAADRPEPIVNSLLETRALVPPAGRQVEPSTDREHPTPTPLNYTLPPKYEYVRPLGVGGMGEVIHAYDTELKRHVAIKFMRPASALSIFARRRFLEEANILAQLHHPNVVDVYEKGEIDGQPYFVMAYLDGGTLAERKEEFRTSAGRVVGVIATVAGGVQHAHENGVFHRDLKASNVVFDDGRPVVADFGCARWDDGEVSTQGYALLGTLSHMAPEVLERGSKGHDARADLWSLGVMLYHLLSGELPFTTEPRSPEGRAKLLRDELTPVRDCPKHVPGVDDALEAIVRKALAKNPDDRYQTAAEFADDLRSWVPTAPPPTVADATPVPAPRPAGKWRLLAIAGVALLPLLGVGAVAFWPKGGMRPTVSTAAETSPMAVARSLADRLKRPDDHVDFVRGTGMPEELAGDLPGVAGAASLSADKYCQLDSGRNVMLELGNEELRFSYRISAEVRFVSEAADAKVGLYSNRKAHRQPDGTVTHVAFVACFGRVTVLKPEDAPRFRGKDGWAASPAAISRDGLTFLPVPEQWTPVPQDPPLLDAKSGVFHTVHIDVLVDRWQGWRDSLATKPVARGLALAQLEDAMTTNGQALGRPAFGDGFGLFVSLGVGQFRNVRITRRAD